jgi:glutamyl-tRNA reductase
VSLQEHLETVRQAEIDRLRGRLGTLTPEQEMAIEQLTRGIVNKIMHTPITTLKSAARGGDQATTVVELVKKLFNLHGPEAKQEEVPVPKPRKAESPASQAVGVGVSADSKQNSKTQS